MRFLSDLGFDKDEIKNFKDNLENAKRCCDTQLGEFIFDNSFK